MRIGRKEVAQKETLGEMQKRLEEERRSNFNKIVDVAVPVIAAVALAIAFIESGVPPVVAVACGASVGGAARFCFASSSSAKIDEARDVALVRTKKGDEAVQERKTTGITLRGRPETLAVAQSDEMGR